MNPKLWEKLPEETSRQYEAFVLYRDMGPERSVNAVAKVWWLVVLLADYVNGPVPILG